MSEVRKHQINFVVNESEYQLIKDKMDLFGGQNMSAYLRKMAIDGYVINFDIPELKELISSLRRISNNINQIAKRVNSMGRIYDNEIEEIQNCQTELWKKADEIILKLTKIS